MKLKRSVRMARLGIALVSFANATAALAVPKAFAYGCAGALPAIEAAASRALQVRVQRPPRVPRREAFVPGPSAAAAAGADE